MTLYTHITNPSTKFLILAKDGKIRPNSYYKQEVGTWYKSTLNNGRTIYCAGLAYKGTVTAYTKKELRERLVALVKEKGLDVIASID